MTGSILRRSLQGLVAVAVVGAAVVISSSPAMAGSVDPNCTIRSGGPVEIFWDEGQGGAYICVRDNITDMAGNGYGSGYDSTGTPALYFPNNGTGAGQPVWNDAGSAANLDETAGVVFYSEPGYGGSVFGLAACCDEGSSPWSLDVVTNNNRSMKWFAVGP
jgi:hypothetical protein